MATGPKTLPEMSAIISSPDDQVIRILLMGRNASGKSSSGNTILGERMFKEHTTVVREGKTQIGGKQVAVIDCPDLLDPDISKEKFESLKEQLVSQCLAGLSAVLLTVALEEPVQNEEEILDYIKHLFGSEVQKYTMILFTCRDELGDLDQTIDEHLQNQYHVDLQRLVTKCRGKFHCFNNRSNLCDQVAELLQKIEAMMTENGGKFIMERVRSESKDNLVNFSRVNPPGETDVIPERKDQIRLVLLGKTGSGKSATGNTIIGRNVFDSSSSSNSETKQCQSETTVRFGKEISVIDTPGLHHTKLSENEIKTEIVKFVTYASPGPHAFIIVIKLGPFTEEEKSTVEQLKEVFGEQIEKYSIILFTHKNQLKKEKKTIEQFLQDSDPDLQKFVQSCGNRFFCIDNESVGYLQIKELIKKIEMMVAENGGHFTNDMFNEAEKYIQKIQKQKLVEKAKQQKQKHKRVSQSEWQKIYWGLEDESRQDALKGAIAHLYIADYNQLLMVEISEQKENGLKEAESESCRKPVLVIGATGKLAEQKMCRVQ